MNVENKIDPSTLEMMRRYKIRSILDDIVGVQPMSVESGLIFSIKPFEWSLPTKGRSVSHQDDITVLLIMGYHLAHGHNCCTGFGGKYRAPMPYWVDPNEHYIPEPCEHDWEVNFKG